MARHPAEVTADRIKDDYERYFVHLEPSERNAAERVIDALERVAETTTPAGTLRKEID